MSIFVLFTLTAFLVAARVTARLVAGERAIVGFRDLVQRAEESSRSGAVDMRSVLTACGPALTSMGEVARRRGLPIGASLRALRSQLARGSRLQRDARRLWQLYLGRVTTALALAGIARVYLSATLTSEALAGAKLDDALALGLAGVVLAGSQVVFARQLPQPWVWERGLTEASRSWLELHLGVAGTRPGPLLDALGALRARELKSGVSLRKERRRLLVEWGCEASRADRHRLRKTEDLLPLVELLGIGLPAALVLLVPMVVFVRSWS